MTRREWGIRIVAPTTLMYFAWGAWYMTLDPDTRPRIANLVVSIVFATVMIAFAIAAIRMSPDQLRK